MEKLDSYHLPVTGRNILRFAFPTIVMTVFNTFYTMVDGLFVSNLIGMEALSAINLTAPAIALITAVSGMLATGGSAVVMKKMGEHKETEARQDFTLLILTNAAVGAAMMLLLRRGPHDLLLPRGAEPREAEKAGRVQHTFYRWSLRPVYGDLCPGNRPPGGYLYPVGQSGV